MIELTQEMIDRYLESLELHRKYVKEAGRVLRVDEDLLKIHDASKNSPEEFYAYVRQFAGPADDPDGFARAWLHHMNHNQHHWQYWIFPDGFGDGKTTEQGRIEIPKKYVLEMIADWMGANMAYQGSWDMRNWLESHFPKIKPYLHSNTHKYVREVLARIGYVTIGGGGG
jgi:hypothetical protein